MATRGRKPKPAHLKVLSGNPGKRQIPDEPKPQPLAPKPPPWLTSEAKRAWKELAPKLEALGLLTEVDGRTFAKVMLHSGTVEAAARERKKLERMLRKALREGDLAAVEVLDGMVAGRDRMIRQHSQAYRLYQAEFGLSPAARVRLGTKPKEDPSEFEEYMRRGQAKGS